MQLDIDDFLANYWQRKPKLIRQAWPNFSPPVDGDDLAGLACEPVCPARLVLYDRANDAWSVENGPFQDERFATLPAQDWTLLVQDVDKMIDSVGALLDHFRFLPAWRIDDVMVSYAAPGGSVGAHVDDYDVFLLQGQGQRRWQISTAPDANLAIKPNVELKALAQFEATDEWLLEPGDMLYLPPGIPHHGVAENGECTTFSIGLRAPSAAELVLDLADHLSEREPAKLRFRDPLFGPVASTGLIDPSSFQALDDLILGASRLSSDERERWFGRYITRYRLNAEPVPRATALRPQKFIEKINAGRALLRNPYSRMAYRPTAAGAELYVCGEMLEAPLWLARTLADQRLLNAEDLRPVLNDAASLALLLSLFNLGHYEWSK